MHLYISKGEKGSYVALSHCWGGHTPVTTTKDTLKDHQKTLKFNSNSKTFADAAEVTRSLGLQYLWYGIHIIGIMQSEDNIELGSTHYVSFKMIQTTGLWKQRI